MRTRTTTGTSADEGSCATTNNSPEYVFSWVPAESGTATLSTCDATETQFNTVVYVREALCVSGAELTCNDDTVGCDTSSGTGEGSSVTLPVTAGTTYFIFIDGFDGASGQFKLTVSLGP